MSLNPQRISPPVRGVNTSTPLREMDASFAVKLDNVWFGQGSYLTRRPCQAATAGIPTIPATTGDSIKHLFEHVSPSGTQELHAWVDDGNVYKWTTPNTWSASVAAITARPRTAQLGTITVVSDGVTIPQKYNGTAWSAVGTLDALAPKLGTILHTHKARMYTAGVTGHEQDVFYSDLVNANGADSWTVAAPVTTDEVLLSGLKGAGMNGGFIATAGAITGGDVVTGLTTYNNFLVVFMNNHIIFYQGDDPATNFSVAKVITGIGCVSQDSIQGIGNDTIFLSQYGFKSLQQIMVQGDAAAKQSSVPINNKVVDVLAVTATADIRSEFIEELGVYICNMKNITFVYHVFFDSWTFWYGIQPQVFKRLNGDVITADVYMHFLDKDNNGDTIGLGAETAVVMAWELPPIKASSGELKARWNRIELGFESEATDSVVIDTFVDVKSSLTNSDTMALAPTEPSASSAGTSMVWGDGTPSADPRTKWGGTTANDNVWGGSTVIYSGSERLPILGRGEFMSVKITNSSITKFRITAVELYSSVGGVR